MLSRACRWPRSCDDDAVNLLARAGVDHGARGDQLRREHADQRHDRRERIDRERGNAGGRLHVERRAGAQPARATMRVRMALPSASHGRCGELRDRARARGSAGSGPTASASRYGSKITNAGTTTTSATSAAANAGNARAPGEPPRARRRRRRRIVRAAPARHATDECERDQQVERGVRSSAPTSTISIGRLIAGPSLSARHGAPGPVPRARRAAPRRARRRCRRTST